MGDNRLAVVSIVTVELDRSTPREQCTIVRFRITLAGQLAVEQIPKIPRMMEDVVWRESMAVRVVRSVNVVVR